MLRGVTGKGGGSSKKGKGKKGGFTRGRTEELNGGGRLWRKRKEKATPEVVRGEL